LGGIIAHIICTIVAVHGGKLIANKLSEKNVNLFGGIVFLCIALMHTYDLFF
jgi:putative Ca2+/H+ antiporter (TMEM165/GDT1 family)